MDSPTTQKVSCQIWSTGPPPNIQSPAHPTLVVAGDRVQHDPHPPGVCSYAKGGKLKSVEWGQNGGLCPPTATPDPLNAPSKGLCVCGSVHHCDGCVAFVLKRALKRFLALVPYFFFTFSKERMNHGTCLVCAAQSACQLENFTIFPLSGCQDCS